MQLKGGFGSSIQPQPLPPGVSAAADAAGPLCRAPQTVEGTTFIVAQPGKARELATMLESHPMLVRNLVRPTLKFKYTKPRRCAPAAAHASWPRCWN